jgi:hypothetical protein
MPGVGQASSELEGVDPDLLMPLHLDPTIESLPIA